MPHLIFDCDGVLVDSEPLSMRVDVQILAENGVVMSEAEAQKIIDDFRRGGKLDEMVALDPMVRALVASITVPN